jgi:hypothetical protein
MRRRGSVSFVVEVMKRRFPQNGATTNDLDRKSGSRISPIGAGGLSVTPLIERERISDPTIEAAKIAARRFFSEPGSPQSARADHWSDASARGFVPRVEPARPADVAVQNAAGDLVASSPAQPERKEEKPRSGRILQSLIVEDPIDALLRQKAEERSTRRRPREPRARSVIPNGTETAVPTGSRQIAADKTPAKPSMGSTESAVSTDTVEPGRKLRGRTVVTDPNRVVDVPQDKTVRRKTVRRRKKKAKASRRAGSLRRTANERAGAKRRAQKRAANRSFGKKGFGKKSVAKRGVAKKDAGKVASAKKTTVRKGGAKGSIGKAARAKKRSAARRSVTTASGRKLASKKFAKTIRSAASTTKTAARGRKPAKRRARRSR